MPTFSIISPLDQPLGRRRLLDDLKTYLKEKEFTEFGFAVAFAKIGPLHRLQASLEAWRLAGKKSYAIFGIDHKGTSLQALEFALKHFDEVYYTQHLGNSFHPKIYWFKGAAKGVTFIGSNNMTVGGTELNFEAAVELTFKLPDEAADFDRAHNTFRGLLPANCVATLPLTKAALAKLHADDLLLDETKKRAWVGGGGGGKGKAAHAAGGVRLDVKPASSLPASVMRSGAVVPPPAVKKAGAAPAPAAAFTKPLVPVSGLAIQIKPHANGEIFLSKTAAEQNPAFFGMPFTGKTTPKLKGNPSYPERTPDPICNITVFGAGNAQVHTMYKYALNTVLYEAKSEIRVTASPLVQHTPEYSILVMTPSDDDGVDYEMQIYRPDSPDYAKWLAC